MYYHIQLIINYIYKGRVSAWNIDLSLNLLGLVWGNGRIMDKPTALYIERRFTNVYLLLKEVVVRTYNEMRPAVHVVYSI